MASGALRTVRIDLLLILAAWSILIATMLVLQLLGLDFGFNIWPFGEFRNWLAFLQEGPHFGAAKLFWAVDYRNALSPWWYIAARPLIDATPNAPLILHLLAGLFVGVTACLLLGELTGSRSFALSVGMLSALFLPNGYRDEVIWNFIAALGCTLLSIWLFALFCKDRCKTGCLAASYLAWFVAIGTYTIQIGAMGAVFFVSLRQRRLVMPWPKALGGALGDVLPYVALLMLYVMLWITMSPLGVPTAFQLQFSSDALAKSVLFGIWNQHYYFFWTWLVAAGPGLMTIVFGILMVTMLLLLYPLRPSDYAKPTPQSLGFALLIGLCIVGPTILLESMSDLWIPGTRWPMLMQFWSPFVFCLIIFMAMSVLPNRLWAPFWKGVTACAAAFVVLLVLGFNRTQVVHVREEQTFFRQLQSFVTQDRISGVMFPRLYLIQLAEPAPFLPAVQLADRYAHTILGRDVTYRVVNALPAPSEENTMLIWKDQQLLKPFSAMPGETSGSPRVRH
jgi:hypothetical protein